MIRIEKSIVIAVLILGCAKQEAPPATNQPSAPSPSGSASGSGTPSATPTPTPSGGGGGAAPSASADGNKELTLEEATAGLEGSGKLRAEITTPKGTIHCELLPDKAPKTVASFVGLARGLRPYQDPESGQWTKGSFFDGLAFHRVIPSFMIQGGDPLSRNYDNASIGTGKPGFTLPDETTPELKFDRPGRLAMANSGAPTTAGSQFFITEVPRPHLDGGYVIFGQCEDVEVVKAIANVAKGPRDKPLEAVTMQVKILKK
jgi:peptidyl-prolyl cis-trans isomerase A (cyclophilin A)